MLEQIIQYWPTALVGLIIGVITQYVVRLGKRDEIGVQLAANRLAETQQALDAQELRIAQLSSDVERERRWRLEAEDRERTMHALVVGQINLEANRPEIDAGPQHTNRE